MVEALGWFVMLCAVAKSLPQTYQSITDGHSRGLALWSLWIYFAGLTAAMPYTYILGSVPLFANYSVNFICVLIMIWYKHFERVISK